MNLSVNVGGLKWKNPITTASGTFNSGQEYQGTIDLNMLGAITAKGVASQPWKGNPAPRIAEVYGGMLNSVGLQNPGIEHFIKEDIPFMDQFDTHKIINVSGRTIEEYIQVVKALQDQPVDILELNISCPNVKEGGIAFGVDPKMAAKVTREVKKHANQPLFVKLSPNVTDIRLIAQAVEEAGADGISMINTLVGMKIDARKRRPVLSRKIGGFSGPAIKPVALRMIYQVAQVVSLPIIGMGGITSGEDLAEFLMAGASAVSIGTANLLDPSATERILNELKAFMQEESIEDINEIIGIID